MFSGEMELAVEHLTRGRILLEQQQRRVAMIINQDTEGAWLAKQFLRQLEECVRSFQDHLRILKQEALEEQNSKSH